MESHQSFNDAKVTHNQVNEPEGHASGIGYPPLLRSVPNKVLSHIFVLCSCSNSVLLPYAQTNVPCQIILS